MLALLLAVTLAADVAELESVAWEMERRGLVPPDFGAWQDRVRPEFDWSAPHFRHMQSALDQVTAGTLDRVLFQVSVRHGKTENNTIGYGAYRFDLRPDTRILLGTYSQQQARKLSRTIRRLVRGRVAISRDADSVDEWETEAGGGLRAVGAGTGVASVNADLIIIDDPIGSRAEAESDAHRDRVWDWITTDILARAEPHTAVLFSMPRWHADDPAGRLQDRQGSRWHLIDLPGIAEDGDQLGRQPGELLWPSHRPQSWIDQMRVELGSYGFASAVQCRPSPREGGMFKWDWWQHLDEMPAAIPLVRYWDTAGTDVTAENDPDWTAGMLGGRMFDGRLVFCDMTRFRCSLAERDARMEQTARNDLRMYGHRVSWWIETESGIGGQERTSQLIRRLQNTGLAVHADPRPSKKKELRAEPLASKAEAGNVLLLEGDWTEAFRLEAAEFPGGKHDDQVDAACGCDAKLAQPQPTLSVQEVLY